MKKFLTVLQFEMKEYLSSKGFMLITILLALAGAVVLCAPRFIDMSGYTGVQVTKETSSESEETEETEEKLYLYDKAGVIMPELLTAYYPNTEWVIADSEEAVKNAVDAQETEEGYVTNSATSYDYYVYNKAMYGDGTALFEELLRECYRLRYCSEHQLDYAEISGLYTLDITGTEQILNKDSTQNYWYSYAMVLIVFFMIMMYGQMIAVSVTNEKSNRAVEVLVTSTTPNSLLFGKVIAGAVGGLLQIGIIMGSILISYQCNRSVWGGQLDFLLNIPAEVLITFALFGLGGYLFYAFLFGAMGALVSKTEDVSKSSGGLMMAIMIVYFISLFQMMNVDGFAMKLLSFLPFSSYSTMFIRIAMGTVEVWEIVLSFVILAVSIVLAGIFGAKIYRMGTLRYGNQIKIGAAVKSLRGEQ